jgi:hypothetical protein
MLDFMQNPIKNDIPPRENFFSEANPFDDFGSS